MRLAAGPGADLATSRVRVLIIEDAVATRRLIAEALAVDPGLSVVGSAANGRIGLAMVPRVCPDVVLLDLGMPDMDGLEVLAALRKDHPGLPVVIFSGSTRRGSPATLDALALGASECLAKPSTLDGPGTASRVIAETVAPRLRALGSAAAARSAPAPAPTPAPAMATAAAALRAVEDSRESVRAARVPEVVVVGVSTGGPEALSVFLPALPGDFPAPILVVQHMPPAFTALLAERLDSRSALSVAEAVDGQLVRPGQVVIAPGGRHMVVRRRGDEVRVATHDGPSENSCRPSADVLFRSAALAFGASTLGVVMTGMGRDGLLGAEEICKAGGRVLVQDEPSSVVWGMPEYVARAGLADRVLPLDQLAAEVHRRAAGRADPGRHRA